MYLNRFNRLILLIFSVSCIEGCSIEGLNRKMEPVNQWYEQEYEATRFSQRYQFTKTDAGTVRKALLNILPKLNMTITSSTNEIIANGYPTSMFTEEECEIWKEADNDKSKELSDGLISLTCDPSEKNSVLIATMNFKEFPSGTLLVLDYELKVPMLESYGLRGPRRPPPTASKAGSSKLWELLNKEIPYPIRPATKEDLQ